MSYLNWSNAVCNCTFCFLFCHLMAKLLNIGPSKSVPCHHISKMKLDLVEAILMRTYKIPLCYIYVSVG